MTARASFTIQMFIGDRNELDPIFCVANLLIDRASQCHDRATPLFFDSSEGQCPSFLRSSSWHGICEKVLTARSTFSSSFWYTATAGRTIAMDLATDFTILQACGPSCWR
jgi:hypothetical protein